MRMTFVIDIEIPENMPDDEAEALRDEFADHMTPYLADRLGSIASFTIRTNV